MEVRGGTACPTLATWLSTPQHPKVSKGQGRWLCAQGVPTWAMRAGVYPAGEEGLACGQATASQAWRGARGAQQGLPGTGFLPGRSQAPEAAQLAFGKVSTWPRMAALAPI